MPQFRSESGSEPKRPPRLRTGSRVAVVAPSSGLLAPSALDRGVRALERLGLEVVVGPAVRDVRGYLAGEDPRRAEDLLWALGDESIAAVWCARGGYGAARTVGALDDGALDVIASGEPKVFMGFSDVTILHALVSRRLGWVSFYGPGVSKLGRANDYTIAGVRAALFAAAPFKVAPRPGDDWVTTLVAGQADGALAGGVLPRLAALVGTPLQVNFAGKVCFFEDVNESVMEVDENLTQMIAAGCFDGCLGVAVGDHLDVTARGETSLGLEQVFADLLVPLDVPCCFYLPIGHGPHQATLPIGSRVHFDADTGALEVLEPAVL
ncbi:MAG: S66 peptidase family protein [Acidimicrobiales bacterium]